MQSECLTLPVARPRSSSLLQVHLLGCVPFEDALGLQRRLLHQIENDRSQSALIVCEHPPIITVGRLGSRGHIHIELEELRLRGWQVRWVNRGAGCVFHAPGQVAIYPIVPLDRIGCNVHRYLERLSRVVLEIMADYMVRGEVDLARGHVSVGGRPLAVLGAAVRRWVSYHGAFVNVQPDLELLRRVRTGAGVVPMTSLERERHGPIALQRVRERAIELVAEQFDCAETAVFFENARRVS
jgi:lipoyl(octanoyl) transferase